jgi:hypothetical protein
VDRWLSVWMKHDTKGVSARWLAVVNRNRSQSDGRASLLIVCLLQDCLGILLRVMWNSNLRTAQSSQECRFPAREPLFVVIGLLTAEGETWRLSDHRLIPTNQRLTSTAYRLTPPHMFAWIAVPLHYGRIPYTSRRARIFCITECESYKCLQRSF